MASQKLFREVGDSCAKTNGSKPKNNRFPRRG